MEIIDCQIHAPHDVPLLLPHAAGEDHDKVALRLTTGALDAVGVDGALVNWTPEFNALAVRSHPDRFRSVLVFEPYDASLREILRRTFPGFPDGLILPFSGYEDLAATVEEVRDRTGLATLRLEAGWQFDEGWRGLADLLAAGAYDPILELGRAADLPVCMWVAGVLPHVERLARQHPDVSLVIDHAGLIPRGMAGSDHEAEVRQLLALARHENVAVKLSGLISHSTEPFPYRDIRSLVRKVVDEFGPERVMWGSDYTMHPSRTYAQALHYILDSDVLSDVEREGFFGGNLRRIFKWPHPDGGLGGRAMD